MGEDVLHPSRYCKNGIEVWEIEKAFSARGWMHVPPFVEHLRFGALEYILRCWDKNGVEDITKAITLLERMRDEMLSSPGATVRWTFAEDQSGKKVAEAPLP